MGQSSKLGSADAVGSAIPLAPHGMKSMRRGSNVCGKGETPITKVTIVAIGVTAGNERFAARYSEDGGAKERLDSLGELA
jgi:hypothetical protein